MKKLSLFIALFIVIITNAQVIVKTLPKDNLGHNIVTLENSLIKVGFTTLGGRLIQLYDKSNNKNLTSDTGCKDFFMFRGFEHSEARYDIDILTRTPEKAVIRLRSQSVTGTFGFTNAIPPEIVTEGLLFVN